MNIVVADPLPSSAVELLRSVSGWKVDARPQRPLDQLKEDLVEADALIVRMTLVPAFLTLLGEKSWYMPRWLDRLLPNLTIEPPHDGPAVPLERPAGAAAD